MLFPTYRLLIKRNGRTTPEHFDIEPRARVAKKKPAVPMDAQLTGVSPTAQTEIERIGLGLAQVMIVIFAGGVWFAYFDVLHFSFLTADVISKEFGLSFGQKALLSSAIQAGCFIGNLCSGVFMQWGRRPVVLASLMGTAIFVWSTAACSAYYLLIGTRFMTGVFLGIGTPATLVLSTECSPIAWRAVVTALVMGASGNGEAFAEYVVGKANTDLDKMNWRRDSCIVGMPVFGGAVLAWFFLYESPLHAALSGRTEEAMAILERMARVNAAPILIRGVQVPTNPAAAETSPLSMSMLLQKLQVVFGADLWYPTCVFMYSLLAFNIFVIGGGYAFPQILFGGEAKAPANFLFFSTLMSTVGAPLVMFILYACRRKTAISMYSTAAVASCAIIGYSLRNKRLATVEIGVLCAKQAFALGGFVLPQSAAEVYPSAVRAPGAAICMAAGKLGAMLGPVAFEWLANVGDAATFFSCIAMLTVPSLILVILLPVDTAARILEDDVPGDSSPVSKLEESGK